MLFLSKDARKHCLAVSPQQGEKSINPKSNNFLKIEVILGRGMHICVFLIFTSFFAQDFKSVKCKKKKLQKLPVNTTDYAQLSNYKYCATKIELKGSKNIENLLEIKKTEEYPIIMLRRLLVLLSLSQGILFGFICFPDPPQSFIKLDSLPPVITRFFCHISSFINYQAYRQFYKISEGV